jgi:DNA-nicking Smr family endonuclease
VKKPPQPPDQRRRHLSKEDKALWENTAETLKPLKRAKARVHHLPEIAAIDRSSSAAHRQTTLASEKLVPQQSVKQAKPVIPDIPPAKAPPLSDFDRKAARRLRGGRIEIEARVDLHGLRQSEAHVTLRRFLMSCHARGLRWVLVITGKGGPRRRGDDEDDFVPRFGGEERGVLKRNVPMWLAEPEIRAIVVSFAAAAIQHGGEGALYVQLRNRERTRGKD